MTYETAVIPKAVKPHFTMRHGLLGTVRTDRLIGDRKRTPTTISHCEGAPRPAPHTAVLSGDLEATGLAAVMAAKEPAVAGQSGAESQRTELWRWRLPRAER